MNKELESSFIQFQKTKEQFIQRILSRTEEQQLFESAEGVWNMMGIFEHIMNAEAQILAFMTKYPPLKSTHKIRLKDKIAYQFLLGFFKAHGKVKAPNENLNPSGEKSWDELLKQSQDNNEGLKNILENFKEEHLKHSVFKHPIAGRMTMRHTIDFWKNHIIHHSHQLDRIEAHPNYPK